MLNTSQLQTQLLSSTAHALDVSFALPERNSSSNTNSDCSVETKHLLLRTLGVELGSVLRQYPRLRRHPCDMPAASCIGSLQKILNVPLFRRLW